MAENNFSALVQLIVDKAQARSALQRELKELQREAQLETDVKVNLSDVRQARKEIEKANKEQQQGTRENIKLRAQELAHARMVAKETKVATDLEIANRQREMKLTNQAMSEELANRKRVAQEQKVATQEELASRESIRKLNEQTFKEESSARKQAIAEMRLQAQEQRALKSSVQGQVDKIQHLFENEYGVSEYGNQIRKIEDDLKKYGASAEKVDMIMEDLNQTLAGFKVDGKLDGEFIADDKLLVQADLLKSKMQSAETAITEAKLEYDKFLQPVTKEKASSLIIRINSFLTKNTAITTEAKQKLESFVRELEQGVNLNRWNEMNDVLKETELQMRQMGKLGKSFSQTIKEGISSFTTWIISSTSVMELVQACKTLISTSKELNSVMTDFTVATGVTESQLKSLTDTYYKLADKLRSTTSDVTISATEWIKQGQSIADTETLVTNAMILSKVGKLDSTDATKYLTSAMKGYKVSVQDTLDVVDKLSAVDMISATDVGGLAAGMSEVANNANLAGISMDKLLGYLAVIGETTQSSMSEVGTSLNAIFSRMGNIKLSRLKDYETGEDLSNVETVLRGEGISLRESTGEFRNFGEVLDEVANNWTNYSEVSQRAIASAFAGTNHMENFLVLMAQYDNALKYTETSLESSGEAMEKFSEYEKSVEAHTESFTNALQGLSQTAVDSGLINFFIDLGTTGVKVLDWLIERFGILNPLLASAGIGTLVKNFA